MIFERVSGSGNILKLFFFGILLSSDALMATPSITDYSFEVRLNNQVVGWHQFKVIDRGDLVFVKSKAKMDFKVLLLKTVMYRHSAEEVWTNEGCLVSFNSTTRRNKDLQQLSGSLREGTFVVSKEGQQKALTGCVKSFPYWRPEWLEDDALLNVETGVYTPVTVIDSPQRSGQPAERRIVLPKTSIDLSYNDDGLWQSLESRIKVAGLLSYRRLDTSLGEIDEEF